LDPRSGRSVQRTFSQNVSKTYELINHLLTLGLDVRWRKRAAKMGAAAGGSKWADMCTGTGETAVYLRRLAPPGVTVYAVDFSEAMLEQAMKKPEAKQILFKVSDVKNLDFPDSSLDLITISFATRNINLNKHTLIETFTEFYRVLKPGGTFINLETSQPSSRLIRRFFHSYVKLLVKFAGGLISGSYQAYGYLRHTIPRFYPPDELSEILRQAGFDRVDYETFLFGVAAIHRAVKSGG
jgi:demethylmenaquinone methyltransferase/2-methoxy-6-polyprenyl-1,4-benzoquinol methylase